MIVEINKPCNENWDAMSINEQGRFCNSCQENVTDFTKMSLEQIKETLRANSGKICGRFNQFQLDKINNDHPVLSDLFPLKKWIYAATISGVFTYPVYSNSITLSQQQPTIIQTEINAFNQDKNAAIVASEKDSIVLSGFVKDMNNYPLSAVVVSLGKLHVLTDSSGYFELSCIETEGEIVLQFNKNGFFVNQLKVDGTTSKKDMLIHMNQSINNYNLKGGVTSREHFTEKPIKKVVQDTFSIIKQKLNKK